VLSRDRQSGAVHVRETPSNQAAAKAGLLPGDRLKMVDGQLLDPMLTKDVQGLLRGTIGSSIQLTVLRGREVIHIDLTRGPVSGGDHVAPRKKILKD
jgi:C-terminal processing protease CtpA/Prc